MKFSDYRQIVFSRRGRVLEVILNRPDQLNAVNAELHEELAQVFVDADWDPESDIIVLTGAGRAYSSGGISTGCARRWTHWGPSRRPYVKASRSSLRCWIAKSLSLPS
ncbi:MAG: enoyl-CoA hydratase/isomerase family protein [Cupriavidus necator]